MAFLLHCKQWQRQLGTITSRRWPSYSKCCLFLYVSHVLSQQSSHLQSRGLGACDPAAPWVIIPFQEDGEGDREKGFGWQWQSERRKEDESLFQVNSTCHRGGREPNYGKQHLPREKREEETEG